MAYPQQGSFLRYFVPNIKLAENAAEELKCMDIGAASAVYGEFLCVHPCRIKQFQFTLTEEVAGGTSVAPTVVFKKHPTPLSSSGSTTLCTLTIPDATAVGKTVYKLITPVSMAVGDSIEISWTVGTGTPTGQGLQSFICEDDPELPANNSDMVASV